MIDIHIFVLLQAHKKAHTTRKTQLTQRGTRNSGACLKAR